MRKIRKIEYALYNGLILNKSYLGVDYKLVIKKKEGKYIFSIGNKNFDSSTAAAKSINRNKDVSISGPKFWGLPIKNID